MSFTKQTPTKPGAYWWKQRPDQCAFLVERFKDGTYRMAGTGIIYNVDMLECGEWEGPLVTAEEAQADAAAMREALTKERAAIARFLVPWRSHLDRSWLDNFVESGSVRFNEIGYVFPVEVSVNAGRELLAELQRLRAQHEFSDGQAAHYARLCDTKDAELNSLREDLAKAQAQCAELRSEVEKAWHEGFIDGDFGEALADDCWNQSRARKVATGKAVT